MPPHVIVHARAIAYTFFAFSGRHFCILFVRIKRVFSPLSHLRLFVCLLVFSVSNLFQLKFTCIQNANQWAYVAYLTPRESAHREKRFTRKQKPCSPNVVQPCNNVVKVDRVCMAIATTSIESGCLVGLYARLLYKICLIEKREHWSSRKSLPISLVLSTTSQHHHHLRCTRSVAFTVIHPHSIHNSPPSHERPIFVCAFNFLHLVSLHTAIAGDEHIKTEPVHSFVSLTICPRNSTMHGF